MRNHRKFATLLPLTALFVACALPGQWLAAQGPGTTSLSDRYRSAVGKIVPRLVRIDTVGGHEIVDKTLANEGTTAGILLDAQGHIMTSAFNFLHDPSAILVRFSDGTRKVAVKVATDHNRMLTLLKVDGPPASSTAASLDILPKSDFRLGQTLIAVGCAFSVEEPNIAVGILSGTDRIWGKAFQTDAAIGPNNYGGPLIDLEGRILGIAVPLSMQSDKLTAGHETYDGGVGMAVPLEDVRSIVLPKLLPGKDVFGAETGLAFKENTVFIGEPILADVLADSPAAKAGLQKGDRIVKIGDRPIDTAMRVLYEFKGRYAGETLTVTVRRDGKEQTFSLTTVAGPSKSREPTSPEEKNTYEN